MALKLAEHPTPTQGPSDNDEIAHLEDLYHAPSAWEDSIPDSTADLLPDMQADFVASQGTSQGGGLR